MRREGRGIEDIGGKGNGRERARDRRRGRRLTSLSATHFANLACKTDAKKARKETESKRLECFSDRGRLCRNDTPFDIHTINNNKMHRLRPNSKKRDILSRRSMTLH